MSSDRAEERLRRRAQERAGESLLSDAARDEARAEVRALAAREGWRSRKRWLTALAAGLLVVLIGTWMGGGPEVDPAPVEVALLDGRERELDTRTRSGDPDFVRPAMLKVELVATAATFAAAYLYDPGGERHRLGTVWPVPTDEFFFERDLADLPVHDGASRVTVVVLSATAPIERRALDAALPERFEDREGDARVEAEAALATQIERELACSVSVTHFVLEDG